MLSQFNRIECPRCSELRSLELYQDIVDDIASRLTSLEKDAGRPLGVDWKGTAVALAQKSRQFLAQYFLETEIEKQTPRHLTESKIVGQALTSPEGRKVAWFEAVPPPPAESTGRQRTREVEHDDEDAGTHNRSRVTADAEGAKKEAERQSFEQLSLQVALQGVLERLTASERRIEREQAKDGRTHGYGLSM